MNNEFNFITALQLVFIILKLCKVITWSWLWVLSPLWIYILIILIVYIILFIKVKMRHKK